MLTLFWNARQRRLRAFWRLLIQIILLFVLSGCLSTLVMLPAVFNDGMELEIEHPAVQLATLMMLPATLVSVWFAGRFLDRRRFADFGMGINRAWWLDLGVGLALGALLMAAIFVVEWAAGWITITGTLRTEILGGNFALAVGFSWLRYLAVGIYEELLFRGYLLRNVAEGLNFPPLKARSAVWLSWWLTSFIFGLAHAFNPNASVISTLNIALAGLFLGLGYVLTGSLALPIGLHITWNFFQGTVFGFPVSGGAAATSFVVIEQGGPVLWTGGAFGPEAGLLSILAMLVGSLATVAWVRWRYGQVAVAETLADYRPLRAAPLPKAEG